MLIVLLVVVNSYKQLFNDIPNIFNFFLTVHALLMDDPRQQEPGN